MSEEIEIAFANVVLRTVHIKAELESLSEEVNSNDTRIFDLHAELRDLVQARKLLRDWT